jgi:hypothetical protein
MNAEEIMCCRAGAMRPLDVQEGGHTTRERKDRRDRLKQGGDAARLQRGSRNIRSSCRGAECRSNG